MRVGVVLWVGLVFLSLVTFNLVYRGALALILDPGSISVYFAYMGSQKKRGGGHMLLCPLLESAYVGVYITWSTCAAI